MSMGMSLRPCLAQTCTVCDQTRDEERATATKVEFLLFGAARYAVCPMCFQEVSKPWSPDYKHKWWATFIRRVREYDRKLQKAIWKKKAGDKSK